MSAKTLADLIGAKNAAAYYALNAKIESGNNPLAKAKTSSASGLHQFIKSTWLGLGFEWKDVFNPNVQAIAIEKFTFANAVRLMSRGCAINFATLYGAHFLGVEGLLSLMDDKPSDPITKSTSANQRAANPSILSEKINGRVRTVKDFCDWLEKKTGHSVYTNMVVTPLAPLPETAPSKSKVTPMNWLNGLVTKTTIQYLLVAIGGFLTGNGILDAGSWQEISAGLALLIPALLGIKNAATEKVMLGGTVAKVADLTPATQNAIAKEVAAK